VSALINSCHNKKEIELCHHYSSTTPHKEIELDKPHSLRLLGEHSAFNGHGLVPKFHAKLSQNLLMYIKPRWTA
jgi:hypothetical protein